MASTLLRNNIFDYENQILDLTDHKARYVISSYGHLLVSCRSIDDWYGYLGNL